MSDTSPHLGLPYLQPSQAQKHVTHNEALQQLDMLVQLRLAGIGAVQPPTLPVAGDVYALGPAATGAWAGQDGRLAMALEGGQWLYADPQEGWHALGLSDARLYTYAGGDWQPAQAATDQLDGIGIMATADPVNRLSVAADATLLSHAGAGHQLKLNKSSAADTGSLLFQTDWSGRAEMGLTGDDDFSIKVSDDGSSWATGLKIAGETGHVETPRLASGRIEIANDAVAQIPTPGAGGFVLLTMVDDLYPQAHHSGIFVYDTGASLSLIALATAANMANLGTTTLTGTTGTAGQSSVAVAPGMLVIENRFTSASSYSYTFLGGY